MEDTNNNMGIVFKELGDYEKAFSLPEGTALDIKIKSLGGAHLSVADTKNNMAILHGNLGNQAERLQLNREVHAIYMQALGPDHPKTKGMAAFIQ